MSTISHKTHIGREDIKVWDGVSRTFTRLTSTGAEITMRKIGNEVDALVAWGNGTEYTDSTISTAQTKLIENSNSAWIVLAPGTWTISNDLTLTQGLKVPYGAILSIASGKTLTINGPFEAGIYQVFSGAGSVSFGSGYVEEVYPEWWGENTTPGTTDMTAEIATAVAATCTAGKATSKIKFQATRYLLSDAITFNSLQGFIFEGNSERFTQFEWAGDAVTRMFELQDVSRSSFRNFRVVGNSSYQLKAAFGLTNSADATITPSLNKFENIYIEGGSSYIDYGFQIYETVAANNDLHEWRNVYVNSVTENAYDIQQTSSKNHLFIQCHFASAKYGVYCRKGNFNWLGGSGANNSIADFYIGWAAEQFHIKGFESEGSDRLLIADYNGAAAGANCPVILESIKWRDSGLNADGKAILYKYWGPLTLRHVYFGSVGDDIIDVSAQTQPIFVIVENCTWAYTSSKDVNVITLPSLNLKMRVDGNVFFGPSGIAGAPVDTEKVTAATLTLLDWKKSTEFDTTSNAIAATLPDGHMIGQRKTIVMTTRPGANDAVVTVTHHAAGDGGTYTFDLVDEAVILEWIGTEWIEIKNQDATWAGP